MNGRGVWDQPSRAARQRARRRERLANSEAGFTLRAVLLAAVLAALLFGFVRGIAPEIFNGPFPDSGAALPSGAAPLFFSGEKR